MGKDVILNITADDLIEDLFDAEYLKVLPILQPDEITATMVSQKTGKDVGNIIKKLNMLEVRGVLESHWAYNPETKRRVKAYRKVIE